MVGIDVGLADGVDVGLADGFEVGLADGIEDGLADGIRDGSADGLAVGVGVIVESHNLHVKRQWMRAASIEHESLSTLSNTHLQWTMDPLGQAKNPVASVHSEPMDGLRVGRSDGFAVCFGVGLCETIDISKCVGLLVVGAVVGDWVVELHVLHVKGQLIRAASRKQEPLCK